MCKREVLQKMHRHITRFSADTAGIHSGVPSIPRARRCLLGQDGMTDVPEVVQVCVLIPMVCGDWLLIAHSYVIISSAVRLWASDKQTP